MKTHMKYKWDVMIANPVDYQDRTNLIVESGEPVSISHCVAGLTVTIGTEDTVVTGSVLNTCIYLNHHGVGIML